MDSKDNGTWMCEATEWPTAAWPVAYVTNASCAKFAPQNQNFEVLIVSLLASIARAAGVPLPTCVLVLQTSMSQTFGPNAHVGAKDPGPRLTPFKLARWRIRSH